MNKDEITKKLQKLAEKRKRTIVVTEQGFVNKKSQRSNSSTSSSDYYPSGSFDD